MMQTPHRGASDLIEGHRPIAGESGHFQVDTWQDSTRTLLILWRMDLMGAVRDQTHTPEDPSPCAPYPSSVGSPMPRPVSSGTTVPSPRRPNRPAVAASVSPIMPTRSWPPSRPSTAADPPERT